LTLEELIFRPADGLIAADAAGLPSRALREINFDSLSNQPFVVRQLFDTLHRLWLRFYLDKIRVVNVLMCAAWITAIGALVDLVIRRRSRTVASLESETSKTFRFADGFMASIIVASLMFGYNAAVTAIFAEPNFRYRNMVELQTFLIGGLGVISIQYWGWIIFGEGVGAKAGRRWAQAIQSMRALDFFERLATTQLASLSISVGVAVLAWWAIFMVSNTTG
jgi:hypothetical protein